VFGDLEVRDIIEQVFPHHYLTFDHYDDEEFGFHHFITDKRTNYTTCSIGLGVQNTDINNNDNLCATYSIMAYFRKKYTHNYKKNQMIMIELCRKIIANRNFRASVNACILSDPQEPNRWEIYRPITRKSSSRKFYINMEPYSFWSKVNETLDAWEEYGHLFFIGDGTYTNEN
tara:strand:- start:1062 stop:1580 length:519 start_codon:yes stop_codon:yes gene_type:complete